MFARVASTLSREDVDPLAEKRNGKPIEGTWMTVLLAVMKDKPWEEVKVILSRGSTSTIHCHKRSTRWTIYSFTSGKSGRWGSIRHLRSNSCAKNMRGFHSYDTWRSSSLRSLRVLRRTRGHSRPSDNGWGTTDHGH
jgi:hypothetical protein